MPWETVASWEQVAAAQQLQVKCAGHDILLINTPNQLVAIADRCTHAGFPLFGGCLQGDKIVCPIHGASFDIRTGKAVAPPAFKAINIYDVRVEQGYVQIFIDSDMRRDS